MKKILLMTLICLLVGGCAPKATPAEMYKMVSDAEKKITTSGGMNADIDMGIKMSAGGESDEMKIKGALLMDNSVPEDLKFKMEMSMDVAGQNIAYTQYYNEGTLYIDMMDMKIKEPLPYDDALLQAQSMNMMNSGYEEEMYKNAKMSKNGDKTVISMKVDGESLKEMSEKLLEQFNLGSVVSIDMQYGDVSIKTVLTADGDLDEQSLIMPVTMSAEGETMTLELTMSMKYLNVGEPITIEFPDFSEYTEQ